MEAGGDGKPVTEQGGTIQLATSQDRDSDSKVGQADTTSSHGDRIYFPREVSVWLSFGVHF